MRPHTEEEKQRMSQIAKERGYGLWMRGKKLPISTRRKQRIACLNRRKKFGFYHSEQALEKMRKKRKGQFINCKRCGTAKWITTSRMKAGRGNFCSKHCSSRFRTGHLAAHWKGGKGSERHKMMSREEYKKWRTSVFRRDKFTCQECGAHGIKINAHHIKPWAKHPELRYEIVNGITLCVPCHRSIS